MIDKIPLKIGGLAEYFKARKIGDDNIPAL